MLRNAGRWKEVKLKLCLTCHSNLIQNSQNGKTVYQCPNLTCPIYGINVLNYKEKDDGKLQENPLS